MSLGKDRSRPEANPAASSDLDLVDLGPAYASDGLQTAIDNAATDWWFQGALLAIKQLARSARGFTIDDVLDMAGAASDPHYPGAAFATAQRQGIVEAVGARVGRDGRLVRVWWGCPDANS